LVWYTPSIGNEPHIAEVILERVRQMALTEPETTAVGRKTGV
jgi:hypothetical protein